MSEDEALSAKLVTIRHVCGHDAPRVCSTPRPWMSPESKATMVARQLAYYRSGPCPACENSPDAA